MTLSDALDRTLLLMRDEVGEAPPDAVLLQALTGTSVALVADAANLASHSAQSAFVTAALLMARSGHRVFLVAPETELIGPQPPLPCGGLLAGLWAVGDDLLPGIQFTLGPPAVPIDLIIALGDTASDIAAGRRLRLVADAWCGSIMPWTVARRWQAGDWPMGGLAAGALGAGEAFKLAMLKLLPQALNPAMTAAVFALSEHAQVQLVPPQTPCVADLDETDFISGGAINSSVLYALARLPGVRLRGQIVEPDTFAPSNLNRYPLMRASHDGLAKARTLSGQLGEGIALTAVPERYMAGALTDQVVVGVDHIPTRWAVQQAGPRWLAIGATTHWSAMASVHEAGLGCAQCLHPEDEPGDAPIPTQACVSFWAGLLTAAYLLRRTGAGRVPARDQHIYTTPFRPESAIGGAVKTRADCPSCGGRGIAGRSRAA